MSQQPSIGRIVLVPVDPKTNNGASIAPAVITRVWNERMINVRIIGDSPDVPEWRTSLEYREDLELVADPAFVCRWSWPPRV